MKNQEIVTFGCRLNIYESEIIRKSLQDEDIENVIVFNTCAVTKEAEKQAIRAIKKAKRDDPSKRIIVTGCSAQIDPGKYTALKEVDRVLGNQEKFNGKNYSTETDARVIVNDIMSIKDTANHMVTDFENKTRAFIQIQNGCDHRCTFCIIPYGRGNSRSVPLGEVVSQIKLLVAQGYNEVVITGVDVTSYGSDLPGKPTLGQSVRRLLNLVPELPRLRLSSIDVAEIDSDLYEMILYEPRLMPHIHISLQAGDNMILKRMKRRHNREQVIEFCKNIRKIRPDVAYGADIIAGFPTETDEMFKNTFDLVTEADLQYLHVFPYSERDGTPAAKMPQVDAAIRKKRAAILREAGKKSLDQFSRAQINKTFKVLTEQNNVARAENFLKIHIKNANTHENQLLNVRVTEYTDDKLIGEIV